MKFNKDKASIAISLLALVVSVTSPFVSYRWLNQVERDDRDRKQLIAWIEYGSGGASLGYSDGIVDIVSSGAILDLCVRKGGFLSVGNVQFLLQFELNARRYMKVAVHSEIETEPVIMDDEGRVRIRLKNPLAPTARTIHIAVETSMTGQRKDQIFAHLNGDVLSAWLYSDAIAGFPISLPRPYTSARKVNGNGVK